MKKFTSVLLAVVLVMGVLCAMPFAVSAYTVTPMALGVGYSVTIDESDTVYYSFTPTQSGWYRFYSANHSNSDISPYVEIFDGNDDFVGYSYGFTLDVSLEKGKTYYITIGEHEFQTTRSFKIYVQTLAKSGDFVYNVDDNKATIVKYTGSTANLTIPSNLGGIPVTYIGDYAFGDCYSLLSVSMPESIQKIGDEAFAWCYSLESITIPHSLTDIGERAFYYCSSLTSITLSASVTFIGFGAFFNCPKLKSITLPSSVVTIDDMALGYWLDSDFEGQYVAPVQGFKIYGYTNSAAQQYAIDNSINFVSIGSQEHVHAYGEWQTTTAATCTTAGQQTQTCACGEKKTQTINALGHNYGTWTLTKASTCTATGTQARTCTRNSTHKETQTIAKKAHSYKWTVTTAATCAKVGLESNKCTACGIVASTRSIAKIAHKSTTATTKATTKANGKIVTSCTVCKVTIKTTTIPKIMTVTLSKTSYVYDNKEKKPTVTVKNSSDKVLKSGTDYTVTYAKGRKAIGEYKVTITFKGNYSGTITKTFKIVPPAPKISSATSPKAKNMTVKWNKQTSATGYEIQYSTDKTFKKSVTKKAITKNSTVTGTYAKLTSKKIYYVRVRAYKTVKISGKNVKIYGAFSKVSGVKIK